ncbi:MAG: CinA family protein, partial [Bacteroidetes bacterium]|nr:CinA family protein [Bacteroidota bacterium]
SDCDFTLGTAESLTGGAIAKAISSVSGSSRYFRGGIVAYSTDVKCSLLNVSSSIIEQHGVVSCEVAESMALGCRDLLKVDFAIATTGIAGPSGGTALTPVGTVCFSVAGPNGCKSWIEHIEGDRSEVVEASVEKGVQYLKESLKSFAASVGR